MLNAGDGGVKRQRCRKQGGWAKSVSQSGCAALYLSVQKHGQSGIRRTRLKKASDKGASTIELI